MTSEATQGQVPDVYGQVHPVETDELIERKLREFDEEVEKLPDKRNILSAQEKCPQFLTTEFKLMFLRSEVFNADLAAKRYHQYWDKRVEIFGEKAFESLSQVRESDTVALNYGLLQIPGTYDPKGRAILLFDQSKHDKEAYDIPSMLRVVWYQMHCVLKASESAQKHGVVILAHPKHAKFVQFDRHLDKALMMSIRGAIPVRIAAIHVCHPPSFFTILWPVAKVFLGERIRKRVRVHSGSEAKVLKALQKFGMEKEMIPTCLGGSVELDHEAWIRARHKAEAC